MQSELQPRFAVGFHLHGSLTVPPATPIGERIFPSWASSLDKRVAYEAVERRRRMQAKAMACPDKRLHPHLCNCKNPRVMVATPKTHSFQRVRAKKKILLDKHLRGETDMYERVKAAKMKYTPPIPSKRRPHFVKSPHYELNIPIQDRSLHPPATSS